MLDATDFGTTLAFAGAPVALAFGWKVVRGPLEMNQFLLMAGMAIGLGIGLIALGMVLHLGCEKLLHFCKSATPTTAWGAIYPLIGVPFYWILGCIARVIRAPG